MSKLINKTQVFALFADQTNLPSTTEAELDAVLAIDGTLLAVGDDQNSTANAFASGFYFVGKDSTGVHRSQGLLRSDKILEVTSNKGLGSRQVIVIKPGKFHCGGNYQIKFDIIDPLKFGVVNMPYRIAVDVDTPCCDDCADDCETVDCNIVMKMFGDKILMTNVFDVSYVDKDGAAIADPDAFIATNSAANTDGDESTNVCMSLSVSPKLPELEVSCGVKILDSGLLNVQVSLVGWSCKANDNVTITGSNKSPNTAASVKALIADARQNESYSVSSNGPDFFAPTPDLPVIKSLEWQTIAITYRLDGFGGWEMHDNQAIVVFAFEKGSHAFENLEAILNELKTFTDENVEAQITKALADLA